MAADWQEPGLVKVWTRVNEVGLRLSSQWSRIKT